MTPEQIFLRDVKTLIKNLLIDNPNYSNGYYQREGWDRPNLLKDTKERAQYILDRIDQTSHLVTMQ